MIDKILKEQFGELVLSNVRYMAILEETKAKLHISDKAKLKAFDLLSRAINGEDITKEALLDKEFTIYHNKRSEDGAI